MIKAEHLSFSYTGAAPYVLDDIQLTIAAGAYVSIVGENGSGKSTLMKLILKFLKPTRGVITAKAKRIGYVPQKSDDANGGFPITVYEMLNSYRRLLKLKDKQVIAESLRLVGLEGAERALMGTLSGGQTQKPTLPGRLWVNRSCSSWTSLPPAWTWTAKRRFTVF